MLQSASKHQETMPEKKRLDSFPQRLAGHPSHVVVEGGRALKKAMPPSMRRPNVGRTTSGHPPAVAKIRLKLLHMLGVPDGVAQQRAIPSSHLGGVPRFVVILPASLSARCVAIQAIRLKISPPPFPILLLLGASSSGGAKGTTCQHLDRLPWSSLLFRLRPSLLSF